MVICKPKKGVSDKTNTAETLILNFKLLHFVKVAICIFMYVVG